MCSQTRPLLRDKERTYAGHRSTAQQYMACKRRPLNSRNTTLRHKPCTLSAARRESMFPWYKACKQRGHLNKTQQCSSGRRDCPKRKTCQGWDRRRRARWRCMRFCLPGSCNSRTCQMSLPEHLCQHHMNRKPWRCCSRCRPCRQGKHAASMLRPTLRAHRRQEGSAHTVCWSCRPRPWIQRYRFRKRTQFGWRTTRPNRTSMATMSCGHHRQSPRGTYMTCRGPCCPVARRYPRGTTRTPWWRCRRRRLCPLHTSHRPAVLLE